MAIIKLTQFWNAMLEKKNCDSHFAELWTAKQWCQHAYLFDIFDTLYTS